MEGVKSAAPQFMHARIAWRRAGAILVLVSVVLKLRLMVVVVVLMVLCI